MPRIIEKTVYQFSELSDQAKARARDWYRSTADSSDLENVVDDFASIADTLGLQLSTHPVKLMNGTYRCDVDVNYRVAYCQGDYAAFDGTWRYNKGCRQALRAYAPVDSVLHSIVDQWAALQKRYFYRLAVDCRSGRSSQGVGDIYRQAFGRYDDDQTVDGDIEREAANIVDRLSDWLYTQLRNEVDYQNSDDQVDESITVNGYEFDENGERV